MKFKTRIRHHFAGQHTFRGRPLLDRYSTVTRPLLDRYATITRPLHTFFMSYRYLPGTWARLCHIASRYLPVALRYKTSIFAYIPRDMYAEGNCEDSSELAVETTPGSAAAVDVLLSIDANRGVCRVWSCLTPVDFPLKSRGASCSDESRRQFFPPAKFVTKSSSAKGLVLHSFQDEQVL